MRMKFRYVLTALVLLWLVLSVTYLFPFFLGPKERPPVVSFVTRSTAVDKKTIPA